MIVAKGRSPTLVHLRHCRRARSLQMSGLGSSSHIIFSSVEERSSVVQPTSYTDEHNMVPMHRNSQPRVGDGQEHRKCHCRLVNAPREVSAGFRGSPEQEQLAQPQSLGKAPGRKPSLSSVSRGISLAHQWKRWGNGGRDHCRHAQQLSHALHMLLTRAYHATFTHLLIFLSHTANPKGL